MPIQLDKILADIAAELTLHPNYPNPTKPQMDDAWARVGKKNRLSVHECRSIFKVLQKKYEQERVKETSTWKLFKLMDDIHKKVDLAPETKEEPESELPMEEDEEYEMLEVQEEEEGQPINAVPLSSTQPVTGTRANSDGESLNRAARSNSFSGLPEKEEKPTVKHVSAASPPLPQEERKFSNSYSASPKISVIGAAQTHNSSPMQKKMVTVKKNITTYSKIGQTPQNLNKSSSVRGCATPLLEVGQTFQLPESIKRKLSDELNSATPSKRSHSSPGAPQHSAENSHKSNSQHQLITLKRERDAEKLESQTLPNSQSINLITIPGNPSRSDHLSNDATQGHAGGNQTGSVSSNAATVAMSSTNGFSPRLEEVDFRNDIIFDAGHGRNIGLSGGGANKVHDSSPELINIGNFDNNLPQTFFKNLCNSSRHEALGLYVANFMNRLSAQSAIKLELAILRAMSDVQSEEIDKSM